MLKKRLAEMAVKATTAATNGVSKLNLAVKNYVTEVSTPQKKYDIIVYSPAEIQTKAPSDVDEFIEKIASKRMNFTTFASIVATETENFFKDTKVIAVTNDEVFKEIVEGHKVEVISLEKFVLMMKKNKLTSDVGTIFSDVGDIARHKWDAGKKEREKVKVFTKALKDVFSSEAQNTFRRIEDPEGYAEYISKTFANAFIKSELFDAEECKEIKDGFLSDEGKEDLAEKISDYWKFKDKMKKTSLKEIIKFLFDEFKELFEIDELDDDFLDDELGDDSHPWRNPAWYEGESDFDSQSDDVDSETEPKEVTEPKESTNSEKEPEAVFNMAPLYDLTLEELIELPGIGQITANKISEAVENGEAVMDFDEFINKFKIQKKFASKLYDAIEKLSE